MRLKPISNVLVSMGIGVTLAISLGVAAISSDNQSVPTRAHGPHMISGLVLARDGAPVPHADIGVYVQEQLPDRDALTLIAAGHTDPTGKFVIHGRLRTAPFTANPDGSVTLQVDVDDGVDITHFDIDARPPAPRRGRPDWTWGDVVDTGYLPKQAEARAQGNAGSVLADLTLRLPGNRVGNAQARAGNGPSSETSAGVEPAIALVKHDGAWCSKQYWRWMRKTARFRHAPVMHIFQRNRTGMNYKWYTTRQTKLQIAYTGEGTVKGVGYAGGLAYTREKKTTNWIDAKWRRKAKGRNLVLKTEWRYQKQKLICETSMSGTGMDGAYDTGHRRFKARTWTLGNHDAKSGLWWPCPVENRTVISHKVGINNGKTHRWNAWFEIVGVHLDSTQTNTSRTVLSIWPAGKFNRARICGRGGKPGNAALVREYPW